MLWEVKIQTQYTNTKEFIEEGILKIALSVLAFAANMAKIKTKDLNIWSN